MVERKTCLKPLSTSHLIQFPLKELNTECENDKKSEFIKLLGKWIKCLNLNCNELPLTRFRCVIIELIDWYVTLLIKAIQVHGGMGYSSETF